MPSEINHGLVKTNSSGEVESVTFKTTGQSFYDKIEIQRNTLLYLKEERNVDLSKIDVYQMDSVNPFKATKGDAFLKIMEHYL